MLTAELRRLHSYLVLLGSGSNLKPRSDSVGRIVELLVSGQYYKICQSEPLKNLIFENDEFKSFSTGFIQGNVDLKSYVDSVSQAMLNSVFASAITVEKRSTAVLAIAVMFLQMFVQTNFTGPKLPFDSQSGIPQLGFLNIVIKHSLLDTSFANTLQKQCIDLLSISGQQPYQLVQSPIFLLFSLRLLEILIESPITLLGSHETVTQENVLIDSKLPSIGEEDAVLASICWWRSRALQVQQSLLPEESSILITLSFQLLTAATVGALIDTENVNSDSNQALLVVYHLETAKNALAANSDTQVSESLARAKRVSGLEFVLTGCKAKRTKFQQSSVSALTILAKSQDSMLSFASGEKTGSPQDVLLESDLLLEKPEFDHIGHSDSFESDESTKRIKLDYSNYNGDGEEDQESKLLPLAMTEELIPESLKNLNPNDQPALSNLDNIQLLLRLEAVRVNTPVGNNLVNEELLALVHRIIFAPEGSVNWLVYSRALWLRSFVETKSSRTVERGVIQLHSLVEELGIESDKTARIFPKKEDEITYPTDMVSIGLDDNKVLINAVRSKFIYQLPLMTRWSMDETLAENLVELGSLTSALEIYERLQDWTGAALCCGSTGDHAKAEELLSKSLSNNPNDARALSILGDLKQDPSLWEKSWAVGRYANAKRSLAKYYYSPPAGSGLVKNPELTLKHMSECLKANPLSFENWYFYGCIALEVADYELAGSAFTRCVTMDETSSYSWSNLASALLEMNKTQQAFHALKKAVNAGEETKISWRIWDNYLIVGARLGQWDDVLIACKTLLNVKKNDSEGSLDLPIVAKLVDVLCSNPFPNENERQTHFQKSCIDFVCNTIPSVVSNSPKVWRLVARVDLWRKKPWLALEDYKKAYSSVADSPELASRQDIWNQAVDACGDLISAYENFGEMTGRHGAGDVVCKDWKLKARDVVASLIAKGQSSWINSQGWQVLQEFKQEAANY